MKFCFPSKPKSFDFCGDIFELLGIKFKNWGFLFKFKGIFTKIEEYELKIPKFAENFLSIRVKNLSPRGVVF